MRRRKPKTIKLSRVDQREIQRLLDDGRTEQRIVRRGQVLLAMKNAKTVVSELCQEVGMTRVLAFGIYAADTTRWAWMSFTTRFVRVVRVKSPLWKEYPLNNWLVTSHLALVWK